MCSDPTDVLGLSGLFLVYGLTAVVAVVFFYFMLPETKGKTLEEIDKELRLHRCVLQCVHLSKYTKSCVLTCETLT